MPAPPELLLTPNPTLALRSDGYLVGIAPGAGSARQPTTAELHAAADLAFARGLHIMSTSGGGGDASFLWDGWPEIRKLITGITTVVSIVVPVVGFVTAVITALELLGITGSKYDPIFQRIDALNQKLDRILAELSGTQKLVYSSWASGHWRDIALLLGRTSAAVDAVREVVTYHEDTTSLAVIQKLAIADFESRAVVGALIAGGLNTGFWLRPHFGEALNMAAWEFKTDDRPDVSGDGRVWDYRIALPTLLIAITARIMIVKTRYPAPQANSRLCAEAWTWTRFLSAIIQRLQTNVRRKTDFTVVERQNRCPGVFTSDFFAGAVDLSTGLDDFINLDAYGFNALDAYLRKNGRRSYQPGPTSQTRVWCWGSWINTADFSELITEQDALAGQVPFFNHAPVIEKQGLFAENRLLWKSPILDLCDFNGMLWKLCPEPPILVGRVSNEFTNRRGLAAAVAGDGGAKKTARDAYALAEMVRDEKDSSDDSLRAGVGLTSLMVDERTGPAFRKSLRTLVRSALAAAGTERRPKRPDSARRRPRRNRFPRRT